MTAVKKSFIPEGFKQEVEFILPISGIKVVMGIPRLADNLAALRQSDTETDEDVAVVVMSKISTFDGQSMNWGDLQKMTTADYKVMVKYYHRAQEGKFTDTEGNENAPKQ